jgi:hypothetical protein
LTDFFIFVRTAIPHQNQFFDFLRIAILGLPTGSFFEKERTTPHWLLPSACEFFLLIKRETHLTGCHHHHDVFSLFVITCLSFILRLKMFILCSLQHDNCNPNNSYQLVDIVSMDCSSMRRSMDPFLQLSPLLSFCKFWCIT